MNCKQFFSFLILIITMATQYAASDKADVRRALIQAKRFATRAHYAALAYVEAQAKLEANPCSKTFLEVDKASKNVAKSVLIAAKKTKTFNLIYKEKAAAHGLLLLMSAKKFEKTSPAIAGKCKRNNA